MRTLQVFAKVVRCAMRTLQVFAKVVRCAMRTLQIGFFVSPR